MHKNKLLKKTLIMGIVVLLTFASLPLVSGDNLYSINREFRTFENDIPPSPEVMYENLLIRARGLYLFDILMVILTGDPVPFLETMIVNHGNETVTVDILFKLVAIPENRVLGVVDNCPTQKLPPFDNLVIFLFDQYVWKELGYTFGLFDYILELHVHETNSDITVVFHGFVFVIGAMIFNPDGKLVE